MKIIDKEILAQTQDTRIIRFKIYAPLIASRVQAGQFVVVMAAEEGERIPLTVVEKDEEQGEITLIVQEVGFSTKFLGRLNAGDSLYAIVGPLGHPTDIKNYGRAILVGGGVGIAEIYPVAKALKAAGNHITAILGTRTKDLLILEEELKAVSNEVHIATDDGSYGKKGFTTDILKELLTYNVERTTYDLIYAVGPIPMMKKVAEVSRGFGIKTTVSLNALMVDATGMCGGCRVGVGGKVKFSCVDGPEFDGHLVNWEELEKRIRVYTDKEREICKVNSHLT